MVVADDAGEDVVVLGVEIIQDDLRQMAALFEGIEVEFQASSMGRIIRGVAADVASELMKEASVGVPQSSKVQLLRPAFLGVELTEVEHEVAAEAGDFIRGDALMKSCFVEDRCGFGIRCRFGVHRGEAVIAQATTVVVEEVVAIVQRTEEGTEGRAGFIAHRGELVRPCIPGREVFKAHPRVWAEGRIDFDIEIRKRGNSFVMSEVVGGIVRRADDADVRAAEELATTELRRGELLIAAIPDALGGLLVQEIVDSEEAFQFQGRPMIKRVPQGVWDRFGEGEKLLFPRRSSRDVAFRDAICSHGPPLVVITTEPDMGEAFEALIPRNLVYREMRVVVENWLVLRKVVIQTAGGFGGEKKIVVKEGHARELTRMVGRFNIQNPRIKEELCSLDYAFLLLGSCQS